MSKQAEYWQECVSEAMHMVGIAATDKQIEEIAAVMEGAHENYGMAFYSPPSSDRLSEIEREWRGKLEALQREFESYRSGAEKAVRVALRQRHDAAVSIRNDGSVFRHSGRTERIL